MTVQNKDCPIGVFDSGQGGLTVLRKIVDLMPKENYIFYGDSLNAPYGIKSPEQVYTLSKKICEMFINKYHVKAIVIACNTATSAAAKQLRTEYDLPIIGIEPAIKPAVEQHPHTNIVAMATPLTLKEAKFNQLMNKYEAQANVIKVPAPDLVEFVEHGEAKSPKVSDYLHTILDKYQDNISSVVLGCTHFPFVKKAIQDVVGDKVVIYDGAKGTARELHRVLAQRNLLTDNHTSSGNITFLNSQTGGEKLSQKLFKSYK